MMTDALVVKNLSKMYGDHRAVDDVSFSVAEGEIFGLIGPNGAGKTTTLRMISTLLTMTSGDITVYGKDMRTESDGIRKMISYLPEDAGAYKDLTGYAYLTFMAGFFANGAEMEGIVARGVEIANLGTRIDSKVSTYSKGMMRRLLIARAIMPGPKLAILDEITSGLDVINAFDIRDIVRSIAKSGVSVLLSSHNMFEVDQLCDRIGMIDGGRMILTGTPAELKERYNVGTIEEVFIKAAVKR
ncbi:MAG: ABC transporter ATP-binding protein [Methanomassiliicoccaceae archaeon]|jgi:ABC-2 type transport system ATP-binding protein|nr:ABC transporter ATP-binding protein [Methanomassiliicoccaceae archaeon]